MDKICAENFFVLSFVVSPSLRGRRPLAPNGNETASECEKIRSISFHHTPSLLFLIFCPLQARSFVRSLARSPRPENAKELFTTRTSFLLKTANSTLPEIAANLESTPAQNLIILKYCRLPITRTPRTEIDFPSYIYSNFTLRQLEPSITRPDSITRTMSVNTWQV